MTANPKKYCKNLTLLNIPKQQFTTWYNIFEQQIKRSQLLISEPDVLAVDLLQLVWSKVAFNTQNCANLISWTTSDHVRHNRGAHFQKVGDVEIVGGYHQTKSIS